jgi:hypothetical protein
MPWVTVSSPVPVEDKPVEADIDRTDIWSRQH